MELLPKRKSLRFSLHIWLVLGMFAVVVATFVEYVVAEKQIDRANDLRQQSILLAEELRQSSDDLTRMARTYVATGEAIYKKHYREILDIRDGRKPRPVDYQGIYWDLVMSDDRRPRPFGEEAIPLLVMMKKANFTDRELAKLNEAKANSDALTDTELTAMKLVEGADSLAHASRVKAIQMLHGTAYHEAKARIMEPIGEFFAMVDRRTAAAVQTAKVDAYNLRLTLIFFSVLLILLILDVRRQQKAMLGGALEDIYTGIAEIGAENTSVPIVVARGAEDSILSWILETRSKLAQVDAERRQAEAALRLSHTQLNEAQRIAGIGSWTLDLSSNHLEWSDEIFRIFEIDPTRFGASYDAFLNLIHPEDRDMVNTAYTNAVASRAPYEITHRLLFPDGRIKFVHERGETVYDDDPSGAPLLSRGTVQDVTASKSTEETLRLHANIFERSGEAIMVTDKRNAIVAVNHAFTLLTGYVLDDVRGQNPRVLASDRTPRETYQIMWAALNATGFWQGELWDRRKEGTVYPKWAAISLIRDDAGQVTHHIASFTDISARKAAEERIHRLAHHDVLTGLFNRFSLEERMEQALLSAQREKRQLAVMFLDMDRFKLVNDTLGHHVGDGLLIEVARRLQASVRDSDIVARLGGDEFVVTLTGVEAAMVSAASVAGKILSLLGDPYVIDGHELRSTPSIGIAIYPDDGADVNTLMRNADTAMYHAKQQGRNNCQFFTSAMNEATRERVAMERELRIALTEKHFVLHYQPQVCTVDSRICGVEALVRWRHPDKGLIPPGKFIPLAEETGLIEALSTWVLDEACRQVAEWKSQGIAGVRVAVNLSASQLRSHGLVDEVSATMARHGIQEGELELEVTESTAMADPERAIGQLLSLRKLGVDLAIDDFGTGYSSLAYLKLLPIQTLKLDRSFVADIETDEDDAAISAATLALARNLGLKVVAEGVETEGQRAFLAAHKCDFLQGYLFSKPLPAEQAAARLAAGYLYPDPAA